MTTQAIARRRRPRGLHPKRTGEELQPKRLPEYLEADEVDAVIRAAEDPRAKASHAHSVARRPSRVRGAGARRVRPLAGLGPAHDQSPVRQGQEGEGRAGPPGTSRGIQDGAVLRECPRRVSLIEAHRSTAWRWVQAAVERAERLGAIAPGRRVGTHTLRHSYARHLLMHGVPINYLSRWLGHSSIQTTLIYLELVPDPTGSLAAVP